LADAQYSGGIEPRRLLAALGPRPRRQPRRPASTERTPGIACTEPLVLAHQFGRFVDRCDRRHQLRHRGRDGGVVRVGVLHRRLCGSLPRGRPQARDEVAEDACPVRRCPPLGSAGNRLHPGRYEPQPTTAGRAAPGRVQELQLYVPVPGKLHAPGERQTGGRACSRALVRVASEA